MRMVGKRTLPSASSSAPSGTSAILRCGSPRMAVGPQALPVIALEGGHQGGMPHHADAQGPGHALDGHVVVRGPHAARGEDDVEGPAEGGHLARDLVDVVGNHRDAAHVDAESAQLAAEIGGVGVDDLAGEDLVADEDDSCALRHRPGFYQLPARAPRRAAAARREARC